MLAGAFMPDYYGSLATHFLNVWVEFEMTEEHYETNGFKLKYQDVNHLVCFLNVSVLIFILQN